VRRWYKLPADDSTAGLDSALQGGDSEEAVTATHAVSRPHEHEMKGEIATHLKVKPGLEALYREAIVDRKRRESSDSQKKRRRVVKKSDDSKSEKVR
jgi:hypothetical protein